MECQRILDEDVSVRYLRGELTEDEQAAFEQHYFGCVVCFERLQALEAVTEAARDAQEVGSRPRRAMTTPWALAAGIGFVALAAGLLLREIGPVRPSPSPEQTASPATGSSPRPSLEALARFDPPPYTPMTVRGREDVAEAAFRGAMERYARGDYSRALPDLRKAARLQPRRADVLFYLGVTELMAGELDAAVGDLRRSAELGLPGYSEPARFYLAMGYVRRGEMARARAELETVAQSNTLQSAEARRRLETLDESFPPR